jgi:hypothetical protein
MGDFLSNLAARSLGSTEVMRPRLASLFEPPRPDVASNARLLDGPSVAEEVVQEASPPAALEITRLVALRPASNVEDRGGDTRTQRAVVPGASDPPGRPTEGVRSVSMNQAVPAPAETGGEPRPPDVPTGATARVREFRPVPPPPMVRAFETEAVRRSGPDSPAGRPALTRDRGDTGDSSSRAAGNTPRRRLTEYSDSSRDLGPSDARPGEPVALPTQRPARPATIVVQPRVAPYSRPERPARSQPAATLEPTIQVTIGRVEVRAMHPVAPSAPRERQAPTAMSLEEYLRRRAKESGR